MSDRPTNRVLLLAAVAVIAFAVFLFLRSTAGHPSKGGASSGESSQLAGENAAGPASAAAGSTRRKEHTLGVGDINSDDEAAEYLREQFGQTIDNKRTQIKTIEKLINYLMQRYPKDWQARMQALLAKAFPGLADQLFAQYQNMTGYNEWLKANQPELSQMDPDQRRETMRDAQFKYFGADADEIFAETRKLDHIYDAVAAINDSHDTTVDDKLSTFVGAINEAFGDEAPQFIERRQTELMTNFVGLPAVQDDLYAMSPEQRENALANIRAAMGLDDEAQARWRTLDQERDQTWDNGERYMQQRDEILRSSQGEEQARRLAALREQTFGVDADTVRSEEDSGFFRFGHRRVYGKE